VKKASGAYYSIINPNSFLFTLIIIFILVFGAASIVAYKHYESKLLYAIAENKSTANLFSSLVYEHQKATIGILESYAQRPLFIDAVKVKDFNNVIPHLQSLSNNHTEIDALFITDQYGTLWANYPVAREGFGKNLAYRDWYKGVSKNWRPYISSVYRLIVLEKGLAVAVSVPVFDKKGKVIGILSSAHRTFFLAALIRANTLNPRKSITLLDQEGNIIYSDIVDYEKEITKYLHFSPIQEAIRNGKNILEIPDPVRGRKEDLLAFSPIRDMGWTVIVSEEKGAILRSETTYFIEMFAMAFLLFVCMTIAPLLLRRDYQYRETKELLTQEKKLRESEVRYKELFENMYVGIAVYEAIQDGNDFIFKDLNEGGEKIDNVKRGDIIGKKVTEAFPGVAEFGLLDVFGRVWKTGNSEHHPVGLYKDQRILGWRENHVYKLPSGEIVAVYDDVTAQKQAEDALRQAEENFRRSLDDSPLGVRIVTTEGETLYTNRAILEIYGYDSIEELRTTPVKERYTPESYAGFQIRKEKRQQGEYDPPEYEISIVRKNGEIRHLQVFRKEVLWNGEKQYQAIYLDITERKRAEEALQEGKEFVENLIASMQDGVSVLDSHGVHIDVNAAFCQMTGFSREELIGVGTPHPYWPPEAHEETERAFQKTLRGEFSDIEVTFMRKNGERFPVIASPSWVKDKQGNVTSYFATVKDITERKRAEKELRERELFNFALFEYNPIQTVAVDLEGKVTGFNLVKKRSGDRLPNIGDVMYKDYAGRHEIDMYGELMKCIRSGEEKEFPEQKYGDKVLSITVSPFPKGAVIITQDITERKQAEEALRRKSGEQDLLLDNIQTQVWYLTDKETYGAVNKARAEFFGKKNEEMENKKLYDVPSKDEAEICMSGYAEVFEKRKQIYTEEWITNAKGEKRLLSIIKSPKLDENGDVEYVVCSAEDITERKRVEEERERLLAEIAAKNQELESVVYTISHDLRAPLVSLDGFSSLLKRESQNQLGEQGQHYLERIRANVAHMNTLVTELLELSRIGRVVGPEEEIDAGVLLREIEEGLVLKLEQEGVEFIVQQPLPAVRGDRGRIRQVFANLIENAVKFRSAERALRIEVGCEEEGGLYRFHVGDNGIGILPQYQEQIFEPFRQLDSGIEGVGMGLTLVKRIVEHHGGRVWVESEVGKGSTFYFTIPDRHS